MPQANGIERKVGLPLSKSVAPSCVRIAETNAKSADGMIALSVTIRRPKLTARAIYAELLESGRLTLSVAEAAILCDVSEHTLRADLASGAVLYERRGQRVLRIPAAPLLAKLGISFPRELLNNEAAVHAAASIRNTKGNIQDANSSTT